MTTEQASAIEVPVPTSTPEPTPVPEGADTGVEPSDGPSVVELQEQLASVQAERDSVIQSRDSLRGRQRADGERKMEMELIRSEIALIGDHIANPDADPDTFRQQRSEVQGALTVRQKSESYASSVADLMESFDLEYDSEPTMQSIAHEWSQAMAGENPTEKDVDGLYRKSLDQIKVLAKSSKSKAVSAAEKRGEEKGLSAAQARLEAAGVRDLGTGPPAGGTAQKTLEDLSRMDTRKMNQGELREHNKLLDAAFKAAR